MSTQALTAYVAPGDVPAEFWSEALKYAKQTGADPYLLAAIGKHETGYGTLGAGRDGFSLGYGYYGPGDFNINYMDLPGRYDSQLYGAGQQINSFFHNNPVTLDSLKAFQDQSWKPGDTNWYQGVWSAYSSYNRDPNVPGNHTPTLGEKVGTIPDDSPLGVAKNLASGDYKGTLAFYVTMVLVAGLGVFSLSKVFGGGNASASH